jgi:two-component system, OmpR family, sensor histidine kinase QseC
MVHRMRCTPWNQTTTGFSYSTYQRSPHSITPIPSAVPTEIRPMINALNNLFQRIEQTRARELRFTADATHELRSPLAALKV